MPRAIGLLSFSLLDARLFVVNYFYFLSRFAATKYILSLVFSVVFYCEDRKELRMQPGCNARAHADRRHNQDYANINALCCVCKYVCVLSS